MKWKPKDVIACLVISGCIALKCLGYDTTISWALLAVVAAYYGIEISPYVKLGGKNTKKKED